MLWRKDEYTNLKPFPKKKESSRDVVKKGTHIPNRILKRDDHFHAEHVKENYLMTANGRWVYLALSTLLLQKHFFFLFCFPRSFLSIRN